MQKLIEELGLGGSGKRKEVAGLVEEAFAQSEALAGVARNLEQVSRPDAALRIAELILNECDRGCTLHGWMGYLRICRPSRRSPGNRPRQRCTHVALRFSHPHELFRRQSLRFPRLSISTGGADSTASASRITLRTQSGSSASSSELTNPTLAWDQLDEYFDMIERERRRVAEIQTCL